jgi:hypothetical protein
LQLEPQHKQAGLLRSLAFAGLAAMSFIQKRNTPHYTSAFAGNLTACRVNVKIGQELVTRSTPVPHK